MPEGASAVAEAIAAARTRTGIPDVIDPARFNSLVELIDHCVTTYASKPAVTSLGNTLSYRELDDASAAFAAYIQNYTDLQPGDRIAIQMPNLVQYPVTLFGALRAGLVVVNTNPLYSAREIRHQLNDAEVKALVVLANVADTVAGELANTPVKTVIVTELADLHGPLKRTAINFAARHIKKMIPEYSIPGAISFREVIAKGRKHALKPVQSKAEEVALLQYTGGTTGVSKGAMICHRNLIANVLQGGSIFQSFGLGVGTETFIAPLPLYHIYSFALSLIVMMQGNHTVLIPNPRDIDGFVKELGKWKWSGMSGLNTLFVALSQHPEFSKLDFSGLKVTLSGGMALTAGAAKTWKEITGCDVYEGYGLTETSPVVSINPGGHNRVGSIGVAVPSTEICVVSDDGEKLGIGEAGELCVRGPQVMLGYWQRPDETDKVIDADGWFHTGDIAVVDEDGFMRIVDRKKDMILVSGFNVFPNEIEDVASAHPQVAECAAIGVPDEKSGEAVKLFIVAKNGGVDKGELKSFLKERLTGYKMPKHIEFRDDLPKSNVGKVLRRELRDEELKTQAAS